MTIGNGSDPENSYSLKQILKAYTCPYSTELKIRKAVDFSEHCAFTHISKPPSLNDLYYFRDELYRCQKVYGSNTPCSRDRLKELANNISPGLGMVGSVYDAIHAITPDHVLE